MKDDEGFLGRWSRRKREARAAPVAPEPPAAAKAPTEAAAQPPQAAEPPPLPPVESLTPESDFAPFMRPEVDPALKGRALKALFRDPALYPMDGLDVYVDDYAKPDPLPEGWLARLNQLASLDGAAPESPAPGERPKGTAPLPNSAQEPADGSDAAESDTSAAGTSPPESMNRSAT